MSHPPVVRRAEATDADVALAAPLFDAYRQFYDQPSDPELASEFLAARFPECRLAFSLPRIHEAPPQFKVRFPVDDSDNFMIVGIEWGAADLFQPIRHIKHLFGDGAQ